MAASLAERIDILTHVTLVYILQYAHLNGVYFSQEYHAVDPKAEAMTPFSISIYIPQHQGLCSSQTHPYTGPGPLYCPG